MSVIRRLKLFSVKIYSSCYCGDRINLKALRSRFAKSYSKNITELIASAAGLTFTGAENTVEPISDDFAVGFDISETSDLLFNKDCCLTPIGGELDHTGTISFSSELGNITVGDFTIGFDASRQTDGRSGFFVQNTVERVLPDGAILFDLGNPEFVDVGETEVSLGTSDLLVAGEFAHTLVATELAEADLTGADVGDAVINGVLNSDLS